MPDLPTYIGRYRVVERLSSGGMGVLYLARDPAIDRTVAIKVARVYNVELRERFLREARATGRLNHRNIVTIFDVGEHDGEPFIAMEYVPGRTLAEVVRQNMPLPLLERLRMMRELCDGLACAHDHGIIHRDVKPANLIVRDGSGALTILDFGIARMAAGQTTLEAGQTATGALIGTPNYMAPEQIQGELVDHRCDIFAVGVVFYELLSYRRAFGGDSLSTVIYKIVHEEPAPLTGLIPDLDPGLITIIDRALAKRSDDRYQHLREVVGDLDAAIARIEGEGRDPESTIVLRRDDQIPVRPSTGSGTRTSRADLMERRDVKLAEHLDAANAALEMGRCDAAQAAAEEAALFDPDDDRVLQILDRIAVARLALQVDEHLSNARGHLKDLALAKASESVDIALQLQPESPEALQLRRDIETRRAVNRWLEEAEQCLASGDLADAIRSVHEILAIEPAHEAALQLQHRIIGAAHDHRARAAVDEARRKRAAGEFTAAQKILESVDEPHDLVAAELAGVKRDRRESFESIAGTVRDGLEHDNLQHAQEQMRKADEVLGGGGDPAPPPGPSQPTATPAPIPARSLALSPAVDTVAPQAVDDPTPGNGDDRVPPKRVVKLGVVAAAITIVASGAIWLAFLISSGQVFGVAGNRESAPGAGDGGSGTSTQGSEFPAPPSGGIDPEPDEDDAGNRASAPGVGDGGSGTSTQGSEFPAPPSGGIDPEPDEDVAATSPRPPEPDPPAPSPPPASPPPSPPAGPGVDQLLADAVAAEAARDVEAARDLYAGVLSRDPGNLTALTGRQRVEAAITQTTERERLREGNAAFAAGRYADARRLFQQAFELNASPQAAEGLRRVDGAAAVICRDDTECGTLVVRVEPAAEIFVDDRSMGTTTALELRLSAGRHRIRLETDAWRFPQVVEIAAGATGEIDVDLEQDGFPR